VFAGRDLLDRVGSLVRARGQVFVITSPQLRTLFASAVAGSFGHATILEMQEGESHKTLATANAVGHTAPQHGAKRDSLAVVVAAG